MAGPSEVMKREAPQETKLEAFIASDRFAGEARRALPNFIHADQWLRAVLTCVRRTPALRNCNLQSVLQALMDCAQFGLAPGSAFGLAHLVPYGQECQLIIDYKGYIELAWRAAKVQIRALAVYEKDRFEYEEGLDFKMIHVPAFQGHPGELIGTYAVAATPDGRKSLYFLPRWKIDLIRQASLEKVESARRRGKKISDTPWEKNFDEMAIKSAVRRLWKYLPKTPEMADLHAFDVRASQAMITGDTSGSSPFELPAIAGDEEEEPGLGEQGNLLAGAETHDAAR